MENLWRLKTKYNYHRTDRLQEVAHFMSIRTENEISSSQRLFQHNKQTDLQLYSTMEAACV